MLRCLSPLAALRRPRARLPRPAGHGRCLVTEAGPDLAAFDEAQVAMLEEMCIVVDADDNILGEDTKKNLHLTSGPCMREGGVPHRAFSAFVFNSAGELLMQQRSAEKILFPLNWANSCCSHPLAEGARFLGTTVTGESAGADGAVKAARRKLEQELGVDPATLPASCFQFVTKVHYKSHCTTWEDDSRRRTVTSTTWGEHEIDYCVIARPPVDIATTNNPNEVHAARWFAQEELKEFVAGADAAGELISPWFGAIEADAGLLHAWWADLDAVRPDGIIHRH